MARVFRFSRLRALRESIQTWRAPRAPTRTTSAARRCFSDCNRIEPEIGCGEYGISLLFSLASAALHTLPERLFWGFMAENGKTRVVQPSNQNARVEKSSDTIKKTAP